VERSLPSKPERGQIERRRGSKRDGADAKRPSRSKPDRLSVETELRARALRLLARREHTRLELCRKLAPHVDDPARLEAVLDDLASRGWLSDARFVETFVHARKERFGPARIRRALLERGVAEEVIAGALPSLQAGALDAARAVWARKFKAPAATPAERARQVRFLQSRGFTTALAMRIVRGGS
jgi:regulatory protein